MEIKINAISLKVGELTIELSIDDARKLKSCLDDLFDKHIQHQLRVIK